MRQFSAENHGPRWSVRWRTGARGGSAGWRKLRVQRQSTLTDRCAAHLPVFRGKPISESAGCSVPAFGVGRAERLLAMRTSNSDWGGLVSWGSGEDGAPPSAVAHRRAASTVDARAVRGRGRWNTQRTPEHSDWSTPMPQPFSGRQIRAAGSVVATSVADGASATMSVRRRALSVMIRRAGAVGNEHLAQTSRRGAATS